MSVNIIFSSADILDFWTNGASYDQQVNAFGSPGRAREVAMSGNTMVVVNWEEDIGANSNAGAAYIFTESGGTWSLQQRVEAPTPTTNGYLGWGGNAVSIDGDTLAIGHDALVGSASEVIIFTRSGSVWSHQQTVQPSVTQSSDRFGEAVSVEGDNLLVGASYRDVSGNDKQGAVYYFTRSGSTWTQQQEIADTVDGDEFDYFGYNVKVRGTDLAIGAYQKWETVPVNSRPGAAYVYTESGGTWTKQQMVKASNKANGDHFGFAVDIRGDTLLVGAEREGGDDNGAAYIFTRSGVTWTEDDILNGQSASDDGVGSQVILPSETIAFVGVPGYTGASQYGRIHMFKKTGGPGTWTFQENLFTTLANRIGESMAESDGTIASCSPGNGFGEVHLWTSD